MNQKNKNLLVSSVAVANFNMVWITWEKQRRNKSMSLAIGANLYEIDYTSLPIFLRYFFSLLKTILVLVKKRPDIIIVQNPSIVLALFSVLVKLTKILDFKLVVDAHNSGIFPFEGNRPLFNHIRDFIVKNSDLTIVTNDELATFVKCINGTPIVVEDPLPVLPSNLSRKKLQGDYNFLFICSYAEDEPYLALIEAVKQLQEKICVYMTGYPNPEIKLMMNDLPKNLIITGYLSENEFDVMLLSVDAVIDLTDRENCLVCGAYEAVAAGKPMVLSKTKALERYFNDGTVFAYNTGSDIARCIQIIVSDLKRYRNGVIRLRERILVDWERRRQELLKMLTYLKEK